MTGLVLPTLQFSSPAYLQKDTFRSSNNHIFIQYNLYAKCAMLLRVFVQVETFPPCLGQYGRLSAVGLGVRGLT